MAESVQKVKSVVKLDVGGKIFKSGKSTLLSVPNSYFYALLSSGKFQPDSDGAFFVDRNPLNFDRILDYLREGELNTIGLNEYEMNRLKQDLEYYLLLEPNTEKPFEKPAQFTSPLAPKIDPNPLIFDKNICGPSISLTNNNATATFTSGWGWCGVLCNRKVSNFKLQIRMQVVVGMDSLNHFDPKNPDFVKRGVYFNPLEGILFDKGEQRKVRSFQNVSTIEVLYDKDQATVTFVVDGLDLGIQLRNAHGDLYPAVFLYQHSSAKILSYRP